MLEIRRQHEEVEQKTGSRALEALGERRLMKLEKPSRSMVRVVPVIGEIRKPGREFAKTGMVASLTAVTLTGFRVLRPLNPLHTVSGILFLGFTIWHMLHNEKVTR
ncbi:MAG: hypothetical protein HQL93_06005 [Magnetococcales bacterium]|nr:hypothetical protein [Magnetococcales bacterium]